MIHYDKVWLIDDENICNFVASKILEKAHIAHVIESFLDAKSALNKIKDNPDAEHKQHNLILLDINMPGMNGWGFLDEFEKLPGDVIDRYDVMILTSSIDSRDIEKSQAYKRVSKFISKPLSIEKIGLSNNLPNQ